MKYHKLSYLRFLIATVLVLSLVCGCSNTTDSDSGSSPASEASISFRTSIYGNLSTKTYPVNIDLAESVFDDATVFNKNLSIVSFAATIQTGTEAGIRKFYTDAGFDNIVTKENYDTSDLYSISYSFAHRKVGDCELVMISIRSLNYGKEWASNLTIGTSGDHEGFSDSATIVYNAAKTYIESNYATAYNNRKLKLWVVGYSRGGAVSNVLSYFILGDDSKKLNIDQKNMFVYTFECPQGLLEEHAIAFPNVFNLLFGADIVTRVAPSEYGFKRCGIDKVLFAADDKNDYEEKRKTTVLTTTGSLKTTRWFISKVDKLLAKLDSEISLQGFRIESDTHKKDEEPSWSNPKYETEKAFIDYLFGLIMEKDGSSTGGYSFKTRELYATTVQPHISLAISIFLSDTSIFDELTKDGMGKMLEWVMDEDAFFNDLWPLISDKGYNENDVKETCRAVYKMIDFLGQNGCLSNAVTQLLPMFMGENKDFARMIGHHYAETIYASLLAL